jgi:hypothetical protein
LELMDYIILLKSRISLILRLKPFKRYRAGGYQVAGAKPPGTSMKIRISTKPRIKKKKVWGADPDDHIVYTSVLPNVSLMERVWGFGTE